MNVGIIIPGLGNSQLAFFVGGQSHYLKQFTSHEPFIFMEDFEPPCMQIQAACMNISEIYSFNGLLISTSLMNTAMVLNVKSNCKKAFYVWDLEFLRRGHDNFFLNSSIYRSPEIKLICRSKEHADALENYCNRKPDMIVQNFNLMEICDEFQNT